MRTAFVYYLEFTNDDNVYIKLLQKSILSLIKYNYCKGSDIFINVIGYSGPLFWIDDHYENKPDNPDSSWNQLHKLAQDYHVNLIDVSEGNLHYVELPAIVDLPANERHNQSTYDVKDVSVLKIFNHKFTSYPEIINHGYDRIVQLDADLIFYKENNSLLQTSCLLDPDTLHFCRLNNIASEYTLDMIKDSLLSREGNHNKLFTLNNTKRNRVSYQITRNFILSTLNYDINNFISDIYNQGYWISGCTGIFGKAFIKKHFHTLSFLNYFFSKDDEIVLMLYCFAKKIKLIHLDPSNLICLQRGKFNFNKHIAFHPCGDNTIKDDFILNNYIPV